VFDIIKVAQEFRPAVYSPKPVSGLSANRKVSGFHGADQSCEVGLCEVISGLVSMIDGLRAITEVVSCGTARGSLSGGYLVHTWCTRLCKWGASVQLTAL